MNIKSNVNKVHIEGVVLTLGAETFMLPFVLADSDHDAITVARGWEGLMFVFAIRILFGRAAGPTKSISW